MIGGPNNDDSVSDDASENLNDGYATIIINCDSADHHGPIALAPTNHYHNLTENSTTETVAEYAYSAINNPEPAGIEPKEGPENNNNKDSDGKKNPDYFTVQKYPGRKGYHLQIQKTNNTYYYFND